MLRKGEWKSLPWRRRWLARYTLSMPFLQAGAGVAIPVSVATMLWLKVPIGFALLSFLPVLPTLGTLAFELAGIREFGRLYYLRVRPLDYGRLALGLLPYHLLLAAAAVRAVARETFGVRTWEKTAHVGAHRRDLVPVTVRTAPS